MREIELADQPLHTQRFLERVEVLALDVLDQRHRQRLVVWHVADGDRHFHQARHLRRAETALAGDDFEAIAVDRPDQDRLDDPLRPDRVGQFGQRLGIHPRARLVAAGLQAVDWKLRGAPTTWRAVAAPEPSSASSPRPSPFIFLITSAPLRGCGTPAGTSRHSGRRNRACDRRAGPRCYRPRPADRQRRRDFARPGAQQFVVSEAATTAVARSFGGDDVVQTDHGRTTAAAGDGMSLFHQAGRALSVRRRGRHRGRGHAGPEPRSSPAAARTRRCLPRAARRSPASQRLHRAQASSPAFRPRRRSLAGERLIEAGWPARIGVTRTGKANATRVEGRRGRSSLKLNPAIGDRIDARARRALPGECRSSQPSYSNCSEGCEASVRPPRAERPALGGRKLRSASARIEHQLLRARMRSTISAPNATYACAPFAGGS